MRAMGGAIEPVEGEEREEPEEVAEAMEQASAQGDDKAAPNGNRREVG